MEGRDEERAQGCDPHTLAGLRHHLHIVTGHGQIICSPCFQHHYAIVLKKYLARNFLLLKSLESTNCKQNPHKNQLVQPNTIRMLEKELVLDMYTLRHELYRFDGMAQKGKKSNPYEK